MTAMNKLLNKERWGLYLKIAFAYFLMWLFIDLLSNRETFFPRVLNHIWLIIYLIAVNYILFEFTIPFIKLKWKRLLALPFLIFGHIIIYSFIFYAWRLIGIGLHIYTSYKSYDSVEEGIENHIPYGLISVIFFGVVKYTNDLRTLKETAQQLRIEKQEAELNFLKSQTNPHFLFNTLNNIYSLARDKSDLAPESILRLSKILRYMLYETSGAYIAIEQELKIMTDYLELEKLRYDDTLSVNFNYNIEDMKQALPPLLLIPLVENAFKHGVSETRTQPFVDIHLAVEKRQLSFVVKNSVESYIQDTQVKENIGISNLRRQLELLYTDYNLNLEASSNGFTAHLKINLGSHV
jgi:two-component system LytT family sensor kinase